MERSNETGVETFVQIDGALSKGIGGQVFFYHLTVNRSVDGAMVSVPRAAGDEW